MDCKDLMIGDWVNIHEPECKGHRIDSIDELDGQVGADGEVYDECDIRPIPLTEEILVKNGFYRSPRWHYCEITTDDGFKIYIQLGCGGRIDYVRITKHNSDLMERDLDATVIIHYVHELQHMLRLCGIEKEIVID